ncbi:MAG: c-type cytochrome [Acidobacteriaceae bacterium]
MRLRHHLGIWSALVGVYVLALLLGLGYIRLRNPFRAKPVVWSAWQTPDSDNIPEGPLGDRIRYGSQIFDQTPWYVPKYTGAMVSCTSCHIQGGIAPYSAPVVGMTRIYPTYNKRAGRVISLRERIQECFVRSENGHPLPEDGPEMRALLAYIGWLSQPEPTHQPFSGRGLIDLPPLQPDPARGEKIYAVQCAGCHGVNGEGSRPLMPPLWGPDSFNDGAGMDRISKMAPFVQYNMPQNRRGILSAQDAYDVSAFIHSKPRPKFNPAYTKY